MTQEGQIIPVDHIADDDQKLKEKVGQLVKIFTRL